MMFTCTYENQKDAGFQTINQNKKYSVVRAGKLKQNPNGLQILQDLVWNQKKCTQ